MKCKRCGKHVAAEHVTLQDGTRVVTYTCSCGWKKGVIK